MMVRVATVAFSLLPSAGAVAAEAQWPNFTEGDFSVANYTFKSGESLPEVKLH